MEIPSSDAGTVKEIKVSVGDSVSEGSVVVILDADASAASPAPAAAPAPAAPVAQPAAAAPAPQAPAASNAPKASPTAKIDEASFKRAYASPSVRRVARELGVDLGKVAGSGRKQRIVKEDVFSHVKSVMTAPAPKAAASGNTPLGIAPMPVVDFSKWGDIETQPLSKINKLTGEYLHRSWVSIPHVTQFDEADITEMEIFRKQVGKEMEKEGVKITPLAFIVKAVVASMKAFPRFNSSLDSTGENLVIKQYFNIGIAVNTPDGLVVPVINDADKKTLVELSNEIREFAGKARNKKLKPAEMQGGCFTISSLGGIGGTAYTPIINGAEVAILGVSNTRTAPVWDGNEFKPRQILPLSLSYDHRVIDGVAGAQFTTYLCRMLSDVRRLLV
jgi:pyruvate dehydrogenase E2 component (dihydrolipoamide acetyltransferase)